eukprot:GCRY01003506.1.p1 GENE.GCRY01003506.1~~GCRY01003506.1.p1  ORF type:complete len:666 (-),score=165.60 GCRY01003506.1:160-2157(-)
MEELGHYNIVSCRYDLRHEEYFSKLSQAEKEFVYFFFRACLPGNSINQTQFHRFAPKIFPAIESFLISNKETVQDDDLFYHELASYYIYLFSQHGPYNHRQDDHNKRTPSSLQLTHITKDTFSKRVLNDEEVLEFLFNSEVEDTMNIADSIVNSGGNFHQKGVTEEDFKKFNSSKTDTYLQKNEKGELVDVPLCEKFKNELAVSMFWLSKAKDVAAAHPETFDEHFISSLELLILYLSSGDEEDFRKHTVEWLKMNSNIDYVFGFIETYDDPMQVRATFEADVSKKTTDVRKLIAILPNIERQFPFPDHYKREAMDTLPNCSVNLPFFRTGGLGPALSTIAYCLPNFEDIRSQVGSKQICYDLPRTLTPWKLQLRFSSEELDFIEAKDPKLVLFTAVSSLMTMLHETIGHGSGRLDVSPKGEPVTAENINVLLGKYASALEELRAEILALYVALFHTEDLHNSGIFENFDESLGLNFLRKMCVEDMCNGALARWWRITDNPELKQAHAMADTVILYYLLDHSDGALSLAQEEKTHDGKSYFLNYVKVNDLEPIKALVTELAQKVQAIKSTGDYEKCDALFQQYGCFVRADDMHVGKEYRDIILTVRQGAEITLELSPRLIPVTATEGDKVVLKDVKFDPTFYKQKNCVLHQLLSHSSLAKSTSFE